MIVRSILVFLIVLFATAAKSDDAFTPAQEKRIGELIRSYLLKNPEVMSEVAAELEKRRAVAERTAREVAIKENKFALQQAKGDPVGGNPDGTVTVVEFFDYNCPYCRKAKPVVEELLRDDKRIRYVFKEFPILSEASRTAAKVALAVWKLSPDKYGALHKDLMKTNGRVTDARVREAIQAIGLSWDEVSSALKSKDIDAKITNNIALAQALNINGTPTFVIGNQVFPGLVSLTTLKDAVEEVAK